MATLGYVLPSIVIISIVSRFMKKFKESEVVNSVFAGLRPAATGLIAAAAFSVIKLGLYDPAHKGLVDFLKWKELILFVVLFVLIRKFKWHPVLYIAVAGVIGVAFSFQVQ
jgi:chromate transporter